MFGSLIMTQRKVQSEICCQSWIVAIRVHKAFGRTERLGVIGEHAMHKWIEASRNNPSCYHMHLPAWSALQSPKV